METLIEFKTAKLASYKEFPQNGDRIYDKNKKPTFWYNVNYKLRDNEYVAPSQSVLADWLRKEHNIHVNPFIEGWADLSSNYRCRVTFIKDGLWEWFIPTKGDDKLSFEQAFERGLFEALSLVV